MCGIAGIMKQGAHASSDWSAVIRRMTDSLYHRGPDASGEWMDDAIALGHRRLAILDLSEAGNQPMHSPSKRYVIVYNGEIYNFAELKQDLKAVGVLFRGDSDTEVLIAAIEQWGVEKTLKCLNGMFAFACWDCQEKTLWLVRDRVGIKPLYYGRVGGHWVFASELKAIEALPFFQGSLDRNSLSTYMRFGYIPEPYAIYQGIEKLPAGSYVQIRLDSNTERMAPVTYWSLEEHVASGAGNLNTIEPNNAVNALEHLLKDAVGKRMIADVPLGAFLSGGVDSSLIASLMQAQSNRPVKTFSIGFAETMFDESRHARAVADHLGTEHTELKVSSNDALNLIPGLPTLYDEPFADSSQIPTTLLSRLTRNSVTVSLSGDGADEHFCGYRRYASSHRFWAMKKRIPDGVARILGYGLLGLPDWALDYGLCWLTPYLKRKLDFPSPVQGYQTIGRNLLCSDFEKHYLERISYFPRPENIVLGASEYRSSYHQSRDAVSFKDVREYMMLKDAGTYLADDILVKLDRASMSVGLEGRVPLLDHRVVEYAWGLPFSLKVKAGETKWILKEILSRYLPRELYMRPKMGFHIPLAEWLRGPLKNWASDLLDTHRIRQAGILEASIIERMWREHLSGKADWRFALWAVLMFQAWSERRTLS